MFQQENLDAFSVLRVKKPRIEVITQKDKISRVKSLPAQTVEALKTIWGKINWPITRILQITVITKQVSLLSLGSLGLKSQ